MSSRVPTLYPKRVFGLYSPEDLFRKLSWEHSQFRSLSGHHSLPPGPEIFYSAYNTAITAWHISDWVWDAITDKEREFLKDEYKLQKGKLSEFQDALRFFSEDLRYCHEIACGSKHREEHERSRIEAREIELAEQGSAGTLRAGEPLVKYSRYLFVMEGSLEKEAGEIFKGAEEFWLEFFETYLGYDRKTGYSLRPHDGSDRELDSYR